MRKIQQYRVTMPGVLLAVMLSGCSTLDVLTDNETAVPESVLMTKPLQVDLKPDLRTDGAVPPPVKPTAPVVSAVAPSVPAKPKPVGDAMMPGRSSVAQQPGGAKPVKQYRCGNEPVYTLNGRSYRVLPSAAGYRAEGIASRYEAKYQGSATAGCEKYDLHAFTAAHRTLPLPSYVRVTNLQNNKAIIVKVNDRGPFDSDGLIQLSSAAAGTLGMNGRSGNAQVRVEAIGSAGAATKGVAGAKPVNRKPIWAGALPAQRPVKRPAVKRPTPVQAAAIKRAKQSGKSFFVVVKNYPTQADAMDMFARLTSVGLKRTELASAVNKGRKMHQVRVGPLYTQDQIDSVKETLSSNGLATFRVVEIDQ